MEEETLKKTVSSLLNEGKNLSEIQDILKHEYKHYITFIDLRLLSSELDINWKKFDAPKEESKKKQSTKTQNDKVTIELDKVKKVDHMFSGTAIFVSGKSVKWYIDQMGQLGFDPEEEVKNLSQEELQEFQQELKSKLS